MMIKLCFIHDTDMRGLHDVVCGLDDGVMMVYGTLLSSVIARKCVACCPNEPSTDHPNSPEDCNLKRGFSASSLTFLEF